MIEYYLMGCVFSALVAYFNKDIIMSVSARNNTQESSGMSDLNMAWITAIVLILGSWLTMAAVASIALLNSKN